MKLNKLLTVVLAVLFVVTASVPALADRSTSFSHNSVYNELQVHRQGSMSGPTVTASISIDFIDNVPHQPESDYRLGIRIERKNTLGTVAWDAENKVYSMYCYLSADGNSKQALPNATCKFYINPNMNMALSTQNPQYTDNMSM
ncbi:MAG: hypothetical protein IKX58_03640 [Clostridia bacterium]|nr:hypothetical protein [Clostridia bacterium]